MSRRPFAAALLVAGFGLLVVAVFTVLSGVDYSMTESRGLEPGPTPDWILNGTHAGLGVFVVAALIAVILGVAGPVSRRRGITLEASRDSSVANRVEPFETGRSLTARIRRKRSRGQEIYLVFGRQESPFPALDYIEPIIAVMVTEDECYALEREHEDVDVSWETRRVLDSADHLLSGGDVLYLTHSGLEAYDEDSEGNTVFGIVQSPSPEAAYYRRETAEREAPDMSLHQVVVGEVELSGVGEIIDQ
ncbi:hypothetical protein [Zhihengliuella halotolerans]|uniref:hypothetical protein n=1 Tax=Zhihengliuella halotolerans TaxID=370736 RepID=UPI000C80B881|nr:hypothetical protein [Zhihengliuella halotolerans]